MAYFPKKIAFLAIAATLAGQHSQALVNTRSKDAVEKKKYQNRRLLVRYKDGISNSKKERGHFSAGTYVVKSFEVPQNLEVVEVVKGISLEAAQEFYAEDPNVLYVEPNYVLHAFLEPPPTDPMPPDGDGPDKGKIDPRYPEQWGLNNTGQTGGKPDADINAPEMWKHIIGDKKIIIAVIDTGINYNHPDLKNNVWVNPGEIPGNGIDDDGNGVIDDVHGFNALENNGDPMDDHGHGSHCAGIIGAQGQNAVGGSGVMQEATIISCRFLGASGEGSVEGAIDCLNYLRKLKTRSENPVNIIATSNSWGGPENSKALEEAIQLHQDEGILFLAAAGNETANNDVSSTYPANYPLANIIAVAATNHRDEKSWFSNYGKRTVHVSAPGEGILSTVLGRGYKKMDGTSMAAPFAAGLVGMIKAHNPSLSYIEVKNLLMAGGTPLPSLADNTVSGRRIRAWDENGLGSLTCKDQIVSGRFRPESDKLLVPVGQSVLLSAININCEKPIGDILVPMNRDKDRISLVDNGIGIDSAAGDGMYSKEWIAKTTGKYEFMFPGDDRVLITVFDPNKLKGYQQEKKTKFQYRHISGTKLDATDEWVGRIEIPFPIYFGGSEQGFDLMNVGSNGALSFTDFKMIGPKEVLPSSEFISLVAPFLDDLDPSFGGGGIYYEAIGVAPNREFVVEWRDVTHLGTLASGTFQAVFFENSSDILFNYLDTDFGSSAADYGSSATIGVQSPGQQMAAVSFENALVKSRTSIRFKVIDQDME